MTWIVHILASGSAAQLTVVGGQIALFTWESVGLTSRRLAACWFRLPTGPIMKINNNHFLRRWARSSSPVGNSVLNLRAALSRICVIERRVWLRDGGSILGEDRDRTPRTDQKLTAWPSPEIDTLSIKNYSILFLIKITLYPYVNVFEYAKLLPKYMTFF